MLEISPELDLAEKSFSAERGSTFPMEDLEGNSAVMLNVFRGVNSRHAASADHALDAVALGEQTVGEHVVDHALRYRAAAACAT